MDEEATGSKLHIVHVEDNENDRELVALSLRRHKIPAELVHVANEAQLRQALQRRDVDIILSDYTLPTFDGALALRIAKELRPETPFIYFSGTIGEEQAVESLKSGATDYAFKNRLDRLPAIIERALRETRQVIERRYAEEALRSSEETFRQLVDNIEEVFWLTDLGNTTMLYVSPAYEKIWGRTCRSLYDDPSSWVNAIHPEDRERIHHAAKLRRYAGIYNEEYRIIRPDGQMRWINDRAFPILDASGAPYRVAGIATDISERKKLEAQFLRSQRMESIGALAGGIAHDLNNTLTPILMSIEVLRQTHQDRQSQLILDTISTSARRGANMVKQLLTFARGTEVTHRALDVKKIVREVTGILGQMFPKSIRICTEIADDLWTTIGDATQLHQVLLNLCVNARDAMPTGGNLTIKVANFQVDENFARSYIDAKAGSYIMVSVADSGVGIEPGIRERIFDPFFTTKSADKGTGLGLSTVRGIVKNHQGFMSVDSEVGHGSDFRIFLPAQEHIVHSVEPGKARNLPTGTGELILIVDDEEEIRILAKKTLEAFGYRVLTANNGTEAVAVCAQEALNIHLMLTDLAMPGMDGTTLISAAQKLVPQIKIITTSGLGEMSESAGQVPAGAAAFIPKPFTADRLLTVIRQVLDDNSSRVKKVSEPVTSHKPTPL